MNDKYNNPDAYVMHELKKAHDLINKQNDEMFEAAKRIRSLECDIANKDLVIKNLEKKIDSLKIKLKSHV